MIKIEQTSMRLDVKAPVKQAHAEIWGYAATSERVLHVVALLVFPPLLILMIALGTMPVPERHAVLSEQSPSVIVALIKPEPEPEPEPAPEPEPKPEPEAEPKPEPRAARSPAPSAEAEQATAALLALDAAAAWGDDSMLDIGLDDPQIASASVSQQQRRTALSEGDIDRGALGEAQLSTVAASAMHTRAGRGDGIGGQPRVSVAPQQLLVDEPDRKAAGASRSEASIRNVFERHQSSLLRIFYRALESNPSLSGRIVLLVDIDPQGKVTNVEVAFSELGDKALESEIVQHVGGFDFGREDGVSSVRVRYPVDFLAY